MKNLLVATVFGKNELDPYNGERNEQWKNLMKRFLKINTPQNYDIIAWCNSCDIEDDEIEVIGRSENEWREIEIEGKKEKFSSHTFALERIVEYFQEHEYKNYLILDSDCFPIKYNWMEVLLEKTNYFASIIRCENLDIFPHPSAFFISGENNLDGEHPIQSCSLSFYPKRRFNLLGERVADTGSKIPMGLVFPLIRTNVWNPHPIFAGIYYDMFYHHCCGSTLKKTRATKDFNYYSYTQTNHTETERWLYERLVQDPTSFIGQLRGITEAI